MIVHVFVTTHNEELMMAWFLRYYGEHADRIFVLDDASTDRTREIVQACPKATLLDYPYANGLADGTCGLHDDISAALDEAVLRHSKGTANWALTPDCDEFIYHPAGLRSRLTLAQERGLRVLGSEGYMMVADDAPRTGTVTDEQLHDLVKRGVRASHGHKQTYDKTLVFDPTLGLKLGPGRHTARWAENVPLGNVGLKLLHYCWLGEAYIRERVARNHGRMLGVAEETRQAMADYRIRRALHSYRSAQRSAAPIL